MVRVSWCILPAYLLSNYNFLFVNTVFILSALVFVLVITDTVLNLGHAVIFHCQLFRYTFNKFKSFISNFLFHTATFTLMCKCN